MGMRQRRIDSLNTYQSQLDQAGTPSNNTGQEMQDVTKTQTDATQNAAQSVAKSTQNLIGSTQYDAKGAPQTAPSASNPAAPKVNYVAPTQQAGAQQNSAPAIASSSNSQAVSYAPVQSASPVDPNAFTGARSATDVAKTQADLSSASLGGISTREAAAKDSLAKFGTDQTSGINQFNSSKVGNTGHANELENSALGYNRLLANGDPTSNVGILKSLNPFADSKYSALLSGQYQGQLNDQRAQAGNLVNNLQSAQNEVQDNKAQLNAEKGKASDRLSQYQDTLGKRISDEANTARKTDGDSIDKAAGVANTRITDAATADLKQKHDAETARIAKTASIQADAKTRGENLKSLVDLKRAKQQHDQNVDEQSNAIGEHAKVAQQALDSKDQEAIDAYKKAGLIEDHDGKLVAVDPTQDFATHKRWWE